MSSNLEGPSISQVFIDDLLHFCSSNSMIEKILLFGSRARGDCQFSSDIDLAIYTDDASHSEQNLIEDTIQEMQTHLKIDIVFMNRLTKTKLIENIKRDGVILYDQGKIARKA